jgi:hypothetical protein
MFEDEVSEKPDTSDGLSYLEGASWYFGGDSSSLSVPFLEIDQDFGVEDYIDPCNYDDGMYNIDERKGDNLYCIGSFTTVAGPGRIVFRLEGTLIVDNCDWWFSGRTAAFSDRFDFDPRPWGERKIHNEVVTRIVDYTMNGTSYWVDFPGERSVEEEGNCR